MVCKLDNESTSVNLEAMIEKLSKKRPWYKETFYWFYRLFYKIVDFPKEVKWFLQRGRRGFSDRDIWSFDYYLAKVIHEGTKRLKENKSGYPSDMTEEDWDQILGKISNGFGRLLEFSEDPELWDDKKVMAEIEEGKQLLVKYFESLWD